MDQLQQTTSHSAEGSFMLLISFLGWIIGQISSHFSISFHDALSNISLSVSIIAGMLAARHYLITDKKDKKP